MFNNFLNLLLDNAGAISTLLSYAILRYLVWLVFGHIWLMFKWTYEGSPRFWSAIWLYRLDLYSTNLRLAYTCLYRVLKEYWFTGCRPKYTFAAHGVKQLVHSTYNKWGRACRGRGALTNPQCRATVILLFVAIGVMGIIQLVSVKHYKMIYKYNVLKYSVKYTKI